MSENANSGIFVSEGLSSGQPISVRREPVVAFLGPAPRGPVGIPITIGGADEYLKRFGIPGCDGPLLAAICQFFANGGEHTIVVRVCSSARCHRLELPGSAGALTLEAINPGTNEFLRASVDYDQISSTDLGRFNLVIHRLASREQPIVEQQEIYGGLSVDMSDPDFVGHALGGSDLVSVIGEIPVQRPAVTFHCGNEVGTSYVYVDSDWPDPGCLSDYDLIGCNTEGTGLFALDQVPSVDLVNLVSDAPDLGPVALFTAERYCRARNAMLLVDPPTHWHCVEDAIHSARETGFSSPNVATYFPRPVRRDLSPTTALGAISGALAARDMCDGVWGRPEYTPLEMRGAVRPAIDIDIEEQYALKRVGINSLRQSGSARSELAGLVTMNRGSGCISEWDELRLRRTALFIVDSIARATRWAAFQDSGVELWRELREQVQRFLNDLFDAGALSGGNVAEAGFIVRDQQTDTAPSPGISFIVGFMPLGHGMRSYRYCQRPVECRIQELHVEQSVALAS